MWIYYVAINGIALIIGWFSLALVECFAKHGTDRGWGENWAVFVLVANALSLGAWIVMGIIGGIMCFG